MARTNTEAIRELERVTIEQSVVLDQLAANADLVQEMNRTVAVIVERVDNTRSDVARIDKVRQEDRLALEKRIEELDRKLWMMTYLLIAALLSLVASLIVQIVRK